MVVTKLELKKFMAAFAEAMAAQWSNFGYSVIEVPEQTLVGVIKYKNKFVDWRIPCGTGSHPEYHRIRARLGNVAWEDFFNKEELLKLLQNPDIGFAVNDYPALKTTLEQEEDRLFLRVETV